MMGVLVLGLKGERKCDDMARLNRRGSLGSSWGQSACSASERLLKRLRGDFHASPPKRQQRKSRGRHVEAERG